MAGPLSVFLEVLGRWDRVTNLVGMASAGDLVRHHVLESLAGVPHLPGAGVLLDVGSGNGFPAIPLLAARRDLSGVLLEPRERRWAFLREVVRELGLNVDVRRERLSDHGGTDYEAASVRAVALREVASVLPPKVRPGGVLLWWRGRGETTDVIEGMDPVLTSALPDPLRGVLAVWRRCST
ncbi:MAG: 16S rRNA (guanine(527)-N(7))-methyltransferase RsmG [Acidobacteriota bacterium]